jgi:uncharacterized protein YodC (DUF2158 family)
LSRAVYSESDKRRVEFTQDTFPGACVPRAGAVMCRWTDGLGTQTKPLLKTTLWL